VIIPVVEILETIILDANKSENIDLCAGVLKTGGTVAFSTETVYGLGANALDEDAVAGIFLIKGRQKDNPLIVHVASVDDVNPLVCDIPDLFDFLVEKFWPGPLTLIMKKSSIVPYNVTAGLDTVAVRMPDHPVALALIRAFGNPVAAPSANPSGLPSPTKAKHVLNDIGGKIPYILDGGDCDVGIESTVLDISGEIPVILRPGSVTYDELRSVIGVVDNFSSPGGSGTAGISGTLRIAESMTDATPKSPGLKYRHYSPKTPLTAVTGPPEKTADYIISRVNEGAAALMFDDFAFSHPYVMTLGRFDDHITQASLLFDTLRKLDDIGVSDIFAQVPEMDGLGFAVANRLLKAAGENIINLS